MANKVYNQENHKNLIITIHKQITDKRNFQENNDCNKKEGMNKLIQCINKF